MKRLRGFTLVELLVTVVVIGIVTIILAPTFNSLMTAKQLAYYEKHRLNNQLIASGLLSYAANSTQYGRLPPPYTGSGYTKTVYNPGDGSSAGIALTQALTQSGINPSEINDDGTASKNVRVYQLVQGLTQQVPLYFRSGPLVMLTYDFGAIYLTACPKSSTTCNPNPSTGVPGSSPALTASNYSTWTTTGSDDRPYFVSSLPIQKQMLATTVQRLEKVRDALLFYLRAQQVTASASDKTNWFPNQSGAAAPGSLSGANPLTNQGCRDGWYDLSSTSVLPTVGLAAQEYGVTAWGGIIQYCRDYDPTGTGTPNTPPHYAAIRIHANVSAGLAPDGAVPGNNVVITF
jgi:prepilin-type N-terminal cleavage/methylation domain-containing protein